MDRPLIVISSIFPMFSDPNTNLHVNIICKKCGIISDYESKKVHKMWRYIVEDIGKKADSQRVDLYIKCEKCRKSNDLK